MHKKYIMLEKVRVGQMIRWKNVVGKMSDYRGLALTNVNLQISYLKLVMVNTLPMMMVLWTYQPL